MRTLLALLVPLGVVHAQEAPPADDATSTEEAVVILRLEGLQSTDGHLYVAIYDRPEPFPSDSDAAIWKTMVDVVVPTTTVEVRGLQPGPHAAVVFHDENDNGELDVRAVFPIPKEPMGASRDAKRPFGPPRFEDARFDVVPGTITEVIHIERIGPG